MLSFFSFAVRRPLVTSLGGRPFWPLVDLEALLLVVSFRESTLIAPRVPLGCFATLLMRLSFRGPLATLTERLLGAYELVRR